MCLTTNQSNNNKNKIKEMREWIRFIFQILTHSICQMNSTLVKVTKNNGHIVEILSCNLCKLILQKTEPSDYALQRHSFSWPASSVAQPGSSGIRCYVSCADRFASCFCTGLLKFLKSYLLKQF